MRLLPTLAMGCVVALTGRAAAGDLPAGKAAVPEFLRICDAYGNGFVYLPGSGSCLAVGGQLEFDTTLQQPVNRESDLLSYTAIGHFAIDHRTTTDYGELRTFIRMQIADPQLGNPVIEYAFVKLGNFEAGRTDSVFNFYQAAFNYGTIRGSNLTVSTFKAKANITDALSVTGAVEGGQQQRAGGEREPNIGDLLGFPPGSGGERMPDLVGAVAYSKDWGTIQFNGALHQVRASDPVAGSTFGYALQAGLNLNINQSAGQDTLWLEAAWAKGALDYLGFNQGALVGDLAIAVPDAAVVNNQLSLSSGTALTVAYQHIWTNTISQAVYGSWSKLNNGATFDPNRRFATEGLTELRLGGNLTWNPVKNLAIMGEVIWAQLTPETPTRAYTQPEVFHNSASNWQGTLQIKRTF